jgi:hypothetical protein
MDHRCSSSAVVYRALDPNTRGFIIRGAIAVPILQRQSRSANLLGGWWMVAGGLDLKLVDFLGPGLKHSEQCCNP